MLHLEKKYLQKQLETKNVEPVICVSFNTSTNAIINKVVAFYKWWFIQSNI